MKTQAHNSSDDEKQTHVCASQFPLYITCQNRNPSKPRGLRRLGPKHEKCPKWAENIISWYSRFSSRPSTIQDFPLDQTVLLVNEHPCTCRTPRPNVARRANEKIMHQRPVCSKPVATYPDPSRVADLGRDLSSRQMKFLDEIEHMHACAGDSEHIQNFPDSTEFSMYARFAKLAPKPRFLPASHSSNFNAQRLAR